jgi:S-DNA-T family DNA segregation ATPase FtsK/SpoIIIE
MEDNEYIPKSSANSFQPKEEPNAPKAKKAAANPSKAQAEKKVRNVEALKNRFDLTKVKLVLGATLSLLSIYLLLACVSYLFTWKQDQDHILNRDFLGYIFNNDVPAAENWLGKFGAWSSHLLIYNGFGVGAFGLVFIMFLVGVRVLFNTALLPLQRATTITIAYLIWASMFLGFFSPQVSYTGGTFGYYINEWLQLTLGNFGALTLYLVAFFVVTTLLFNPNYRALFDRLFGNHPEDQQAQEFKDSAAPYDDLYVVNTIREDQIKSDDVSQTVHFDDDDVFEEESELIVSIKEEEPAVKAPIEDDAENEFSLETHDDSFEIELGEDPVIEAVAPAMAAASAPSLSLSEEENIAKNLVREYGEYDPTKDLDGYLLPPLDLMKDYATTGVSVSKEELETFKNELENENISRENNKHSVRRHDLEHTHMKKKRTYQEIDGFNLRRCHRSL